MASSLRACLIPALITSVLATGVGASRAQLASHDGVALEGQATADWVRRYHQDLRDLYDFYDLEDGEAQAQRLEQFLAGWKQQLAAANFDDLNRSGRVDWLLLKNAIEREQADLKRGKQRRARLAPLLPFAADILQLEEERRRVVAIDPQAIAGRLAEITQSLPGLESAAKERFEQASTEPLSPTDARRAAQAVSRITRVLESWNEHYQDFHPEFAWWVSHPKEELAQGLRSYAKLLREEGAGLHDKPEDPLIGEPLGAEALSHYLELELLPYSAAELVALAEEDMAWCEARMAEAASELGFDNSRDALEHVRNLGAAPGRQDQLVSAQAQSAIRFLDERNLVTLEPLVRETFVFDMLSTRAQRSLPFAAYGGQRMLVASPTREMDHETKLMSMRGNNEHFSRIVTPHELIPGHHLQRYMAERYASHRQPFSTPFLIEGWALYWEMLLWDEGWARGPEDRIGMLFWRMHRGARVLVLLGFHSGEMSPKDMVDLLVERIGHEPYTARAEVRRYVGDAYGPIYPVGYLIGGLQLRALAQELVGPKGLSPKQFHDRVLRQGPIPVALVRASLGLGELGRDWSPAGWRFRPRR
ncbi:MAG: hypothetical protein ACI8QC_004352 [Planctomycetota bacterium]|jgi:hypothetical protein